MQTATSIMAAADGSQSSEAKHGRCRCWSSEIRGGPHQRFSSASQPAALSFTLKLVGWRRQIKIAIVHQNVRVCQNDAWRLLGGAVISAVTSSPHLDETPAYLKLRELKRTSTQTALLPPEMSVDAKFPAWNPTEFWEKWMHVGQLFEVSLLVCSGLRGFN